MLLLAVEGGGGSSDEEEEELSGGGETEEEVQEECIIRAQVDRELKDKLIRKYGGYISSLKYEFSKKKKKGKLPKQARQTLFEWWNTHYRWPYPTVIILNFLCMGRTHYVIYLITVFVGSGQDCAG